MTPTQPQPDSTPRGASEDRAPDIFAPLLSTLVFGYYGFLDGNATVTVNAAGETVPLWVGSLWILRGATILFLGSAVVALTRASHATLAYGLASVLATLGLVAILVWDQLDKSYYFACPPLILLLFIAWNGFHAFVTLREAFREPRRLP